MLPIDMLNTGRLLSLGIQLCGSPGDTEESYSYENEEGKFIPPALYTELWVDGSALYRCRLSCLLPRYEKQAGE